MRTRLLKDFREVWAYWALAMAGPLLALAWAWLGSSLPHIQVKRSAWVTASGIPSYLLFHALGVLVFSREFEHRTMETLLAQPLDRAKLWSERIGLLAVLLGSALGIVLLAFFADWIWIWKWNSAHYSTNYPPPPPVPGALTIMSAWIFGVDGLVPVWGQQSSWFLRNSDAVACLNCVGALSGLCFGPLTTLYLRRSLTAFCCAAMAPIGLGFAFSLFPIPEQAMGRLFADVAGQRLALLAVYLLAPCAVAYCLARRKFMRLEVFD